MVLIGLLALTIAFFGIDATNGPLQVALLLSAAFASLIAFKNGYSVAAIRDATVGGVTTAMSAIFILLAVGALIGTWNMAGTIPTVVDYGIRLLSPTWFYVTTAAICAVVGMVTGSSWTTAGTLGVAFVGMAKVLGLPEAIAAGAVICGAYFGDKMTPLSETTILVPQLVGRGLTSGRHIRNMFWTAGPALGRDRVERGRRGPVRRRRAPRPHVLGRVRAAGLAPEVLSRAVEDSGTVTSVQAAVEHLRGLHLRGPGRPHGRLLPLLLLQLPQPRAGCAVRLHRVQGPQRHTRGGGGCQAPTGRAACPR